MPVLHSYEVTVTYKVKSVRATSASEAVEAALGKIKAQGNDGYINDVTISKEF